MASETKEYITKLKLPDIIENRTLNLNKYKWKKIVKEKLQEECENYFHSELHKFEKNKDTMTEERFEKRDYVQKMTMIDAQTWFKYRAHMTEIKYNYKNDPKFSKELWKCDSCMSAIETQSHILWCPAYQELRAGQSMDSDADLVNYIKEVLKIREHLNILK